MARDILRKHLTADERSKLEVLYKRNVRVADIAKALDRDISTIYREIKRGLCTQVDYNYKFYKSYSPETAQRKHDEYMRSKGASLKIGNDIDYAQFLEEKLKEGNSPAVALHLAEQNEKPFKTKISKDTFYRYIDQHLFLSVTNANLIYGKRAKSYNKVKTVPNTKLNHISIEKRPENVLSRNAFGNWEMDTVVGTKNGKSTSLLVLSERMHRYEIIIKIQQRTSNAVTKALCGLKRKYGKKYSDIFKTITCDNGVEFADADGIMKGSSTKLYYCHPFSSYERGTNENINRMIRRFIPKGSDISKYTNKQIEIIQNWINNYPRKILNWQTANNLYQKELDKIMQFA